MRFADWVDEWFHSAKHRWRPRTADKHDMALRAHWLPRFGPLEVATITPRQIQAAINELADGHSSASVRTYHGTLRACLRDAVDMDVLGRSPCRGINLPKLKPDEKRVITPQELHRLADEVGPQWRSPVYLGGVMGLRFGEAVAPQVCDLDFEQATVTIARTVVNVDGRLEIDEPKTTAGLRTLVMPGPLLDELRAHIDLLDLGDDELLFADAFGGPLRAATSAVGSSPRPSNEPTSTASRSTGCATRPPPGGWPTESTPEPCNIGSATPTPGWCSGSTPTLRRRPTDERRRSARPSSGTRIGDQMCHECAMATRGRTTLAPVTRP
ncbi:MAG: site-specific integrase [Acidimicrobiales bacterium]